jgi:hypothetical protein
MQSYYKPIGDSKQGYKLTIPAIVKKAKIYEFQQVLNKTETIVLKKGTLIYTPVRT